MCAKCHDLNIVMQTISWSGHQNHVYNDGVSCSVCHNAHGVGATGANPTGDRMIDFDVNVVGSNSGLNISYNRASNTCTLTCHNVAHNPDGTISALSRRPPNQLRRHAEVERDDQQLDRTGRCLLAEPAGMARIAPLQIAVLLVLFSPQAES